jgi:hypothetical protein
MINDEAFKYDDGLAPLVRMPLPKSKPPKTEYPLLTAFTLVELPPKPPFCDKDAALMFV